LRSLEESLQSEQCRRILVALDSGSRSVDDLVALTRLTRGSVLKHAEVLVQGNLARRVRNERYALRR